jgi:hypothetical protein
VKLPSAVVYWTSVYRPNEEVVDTGQPLTKIDGQNVGGNALLAHRGTHHSRVHNRMAVCRPRSQPVRHCANRVGGRGTHGSHLATRATGQEARKNPAESNWRVTSPPAGVNEASSFTNGTMFASVPPVVSPS